MSSKVRDAKDTRWDILLYHDFIQYVQKATPTIQTQVHFCDKKSSVLDSAVLSGGNNPTGILTFNLFGPCHEGPTCLGSTVQTVVVPVNGNGTYFSANNQDHPCPFKITGPPGTYRFQVTYSGDSNNNSVTTGCDTETFIVKKKNCEQPKTLAWKPFCCSF
jgi:hypothetical protein